MRSVPVLGALDAARILDAACAEAERQHLAVTVAVVDAAGVPLALRRLDRARLHTPEAAMMKARTAAIARTATAELQAAVQGTAEVRGNAALLSFPGRMPLAGGLPLTHEGETVGGIGSSGAEPTQDEAVCRAGIAAGICTGGSMSGQEEAAAPAVDAEALRREVSAAYAAVAREPRGDYHFHTGRPLAARLGYDEGAVAALPDAAVESFAGVANPFSGRPLQPGERIVDVGSGAGFDCFIAAGLVGPRGRVVGVDMTGAMLAKSRATAAATGAGNVEFREGLAERLPVEDGWADAVISNGVINLCADKEAVLADIFRVLKPGGTLQFADIANGVPVPAAAVANIELWTA